MCLNPGVTISDSTKEIQLLLPSQYTVGALMWSAKDFMYLRRSLVLLTDLYMYLIYPPLVSEAIAGRICTFNQTATPRRV